MLSVSIQAAPPAAISSLDAIVLVVVTNEDSTTVAEVVRQVNAVDGYDLSRQSISKRVQRLHAAGLLVRDELNAQWFQTSPGTCFRCRFTSERGPFSIRSEYEVKRSAGPTL